MVLAYLLPPLVFLPAWIEVSGFRGVCGEGFELGSFEEP